METLSSNGIHLIVGYYKIYPGIFFTIKLNDVWFYFWVAAFNSDQCGTVTNLLTGVAGRGGGWKHDRIQQPSVSRYVHFMHLQVNYISSISKQYDKSKPKMQISLTTTCLKGKLWFLIPVQGKNWSSLFSDSQYARSRMNHRRNSRNYSQVLLGEPFFWWKNTQK